MLNDQTSLPWLTLLCIITLAALGGCLGQGDDDEPDDEDPDMEIPDHAMANLTNADGDDAGLVTFTESEGHVQITAQATSLSPGFHGFHVHEAGECQPEFTAAGGHFSPGGGDHHDHAGDMPVLHVNDDGTALIQFTTDRFTIEDLIADDGTAIVIHGGPDNYANIPDRYQSEDADGSGPDDATLGAGDAGPREACGIIEGHDQAPEGIQDPTGDTATATLATEDGDARGTVTFTQADDKVRVDATVQDLSTGFHGFHVHETGVCQPAFQLAGGHHAPNDNDHGDHAGDMPVLLVNEDGTGELVFTTDRFDLGEINELDGSAVVVHQGPDNYANIPDRYGGPDEDTRAAGDAGPRAACGAVQADDGVL